MRRRAASPAEIERLVSEEGVRATGSRSSIASNAQSRVLEDTLVRFEIPYQVIGGTKFYERAEIKDAVAYLQPAGEPGGRGFLRADRQLAPPRDRGAPRQARLLSHANTTGQDVWDVMREAERVPALGPAAEKAVRRFADTMVALRARGSADDARRSRSSSRRC